MGDLEVLVMLVAFIGVPAVLIARSMRRVSAGPKRAQQLRSWGEVHGWTYRGEAPSLVGRWQVAPFTDPERRVDDALVGEHRGRSAATFRLEVDGHGQDGCAFHVLTLALGAPRPPVQLASALPGGPPVPDHVDGDVRARLREPDAAGMSVRAVDGQVVGWVAGEPLFSELATRLDVLADVAELLEGRA